jgi:hypothetical protein
MHKKFNNATAGLTTIPKRSMPEMCTSTNCVTVTMKELEEQCVCVKFPHKLGKNFTDISIA